MTQPVIFISYSHKDRSEKDRLLSHLGVLQHQGLVGLWSDDQIKPGIDWKQAISEAITQANVAILLISVHFLTSDFILGKEVPALLERRQREGLTVFPVIAKACVWQQVDWLTKMSVRPKNGRPIWSSGSRRRVDADLAAIAQEVADVVNTDHQSTPLKEAKGFLEITLDEQYSPETLEAARRAFAAVLNIPVDKVKISFLREGSMVLLVEMPQEAIDRFITLHEFDDPVLKDLKIQQMKIIKDLADANLAGADLRNIDFFDVNLYSANLSETDLSGADLSRAKLIGADLSGANLSRAILSKAKLSFAYLGGADLAFADLSEADLSEAILSFAYLGGADLRRAILSRAILVGTTLDEADLSGANLNETDLSRADLSRANLRGADLSRAILSEAKLSEANLSGAKLIEAKLIGADLSGADLSRANLSRAKLIGANLNGANLSEAILSEIDLTYVDLSNVII